MNQGFGILEAIFAALFGLLVGSFLNVCIYRLPRDLKVYRPARSFCPYCEAQIAWYDNIPLLSYLLLRGRCRACGTSFGFRYFLVELLCGIVYFVSVWKFGLTLLALKLIVFGSLQVALLFTDLEDRILPDEFTLGGLVAGLLFSLFVLLPGSFTMLVVPYEWGLPALSLAEASFAAVFHYLALATVRWVYQQARGIEGLGLGDLKMVAMTGSFLGLMPALQAMLVGSILGTIIGVAWVKLRREDMQQYELPFGAFLAIGALVVGFYNAVQGTLGH